MSFLGLRRFQKTYGRDEKKEDEGADEKFQTAFLGDGGFNIVIVFFGVAQKVTGSVDQNGGVAIGVDCSSAMPLGIT